MQHSLIPPPIAMIAKTSIVSPIGLVLSGGGAKGAYEVGVWQSELRCCDAERISDEEISERDERYGGRADGVVLEGMPGYGNKVELWAKDVDDVGIAERYMEQLAEDKDRGSMA